MQEALKSDNLATRENAAAALGKLNVRASADDLINLLSDKSSGSDVRMAAASSLASMGCLSAVDALVAALDDWNSRNGRVFADALVRLAAKPEGKDIVVQKLAASLDPRKKDFCETAAYALAKIADSRALPALVEVVRNASDYVPTHTMAAVEGLAGRTTLAKDATVVRNLLRLAKNTDIARNALDAVSELVFHNAADIPTAELNTIAHLTAVDYWYYGDPHDDTDHSKMKRDDCGELRKRATVELERRVTRT